MNYRKQPFILLLFVMLFSCVDSTEKQEIPKENSDRKEMLKFWVEEMILPSYSKFDQELQKMVVSADQFVNNPTESNLQALRNNWVQAYVSWQTVELYEVGPAEKYTLRNFFNIYPSNVSGIENNINSSTLNLNLPSNYDKQGFPALDYLINGVANEDSKILEFYTDSEKGENRRAYLNTLVNRMDMLLNQVITDWNGPAKDEFISKTGLDIGSSTASMVNAYVLYYERHVRSGKFGIPSGATLASSGTPNPEKIEAFYKQEISLLLAKTAHQAFSDFFNGKGNSKQGPSLKTYLLAIGAKDPSTGKFLTEYINEQLTVISNLLNGLSENLYQQILTDNNSMIQVYQEMQKAVRILKVDMTSAMSITITYTDNDGD